MSYPATPKLGEIQAEVRRIAARIDFGCGSKDCRILKPRGGADIPCTCGIDVTRWLAAATDQFGALAHDWQKLPQPIPEDADAWVDPNWPRR